MPRRTRLAAAAFLLVLTAPWPAGCDRAEPEACLDGDRQETAAERVVPGHRGTFACLDEADFDNQLKLTLDGQGRLITTWVRDDANAIGTYALLDGALQLADDAGWQGEGTALEVVQGRLVRFALAGRDCVAVSLWGLCGVVGAWDCPAVSTADGDATWTLELTADRGVLVTEATDLGTRFDWGVYLVDADTRFTLLLPRAKLAPALPATTTAAGAPGGPLVLSGLPGGDLTCTAR